MAVKFLIDKNYRIIEKNFQIWGGEIDIIAQDPSTEEIVFVEVKTRSKEYWQHLDQTLSWKQKRFIKRAATRFLFLRNLENSNWRVDFIGIIKGDNISSQKIEKFLHFKDV